METNAFDGVLNYDYHPPDDLRLYTLPPTSILRWDDEALVAEVDVDGILVRHYAFRDHWFRINLTTDRLGAFVEMQPSQRIHPFTFDCDIATPMLRQGNAAFAVDLWLDVYVRADGVTYQVADQDRFAEAISQGWLSEREADGAETGLRELIALVESGRFIPFLAAFVPFEPATRPAAVPVERRDPAQVPILQPNRRPSW